MGHPFEGAQRAGDLPVNKRTFIALMIVFTAVCAFLFNVFYKEAKNTAITQLNEEEMIHAMQAARGIEDFFAMWTRSLNSLSKMDEIIDTDAAGKRDMKLFYEANQEQIRSITRLDERGVILHNFPSSRPVGTDISDQKHVHELLRDHKPVISDVFKAVEGFDAVALHVPVFRGSVFKGSIGILINFESLAKRYFDVIKIGETGYAWVVSRDGTQLYSPISGSTGKSVFETIKDSPSRMVMVNDMLKGHGGAAVYTVDGTGGRNAGQIREYAVYMPVHIGSTFWSIAVASAEQDVLSGLIFFRNKLALVIGALFICGMVFSTLGAKAWFIVKEEEKRKQAEKKLQASEQIAEKFSTLFHAAPFAMALATTPGGVLYDVNQAWLDLAGFSRKEEVIGKSSVELELIREAEPRERILSEFRQHGSVRNAEIATYTKTGVQRDLLVNLDWVDIGERRFILSTMQDITKRKKAESDIIQLSEDMAARNLELEDVNKELEAFTYSVSHDLSAPIRHLSGFAKILAENYADKLDDVGNNYLGRIQAGSAKATRLIDDLLRLSRISRQDMKRVEMDLSGKALEVIADLREASPGRNVQVRIAPGLKAAADPRLVEVVLSNLLGNAWKFTSKTGSAYIEFGAFECGMRNSEFGMKAQEQCEKGKTAYFVKDNGAGFDSAYADKMFRPFQRLHSEDEFEGTGIGLAIVERVIRRHGGRVWAEGEVGKGATVFFTLG